MTRPRQLLACWAALAAGVLAVSACGSGDPPPAAAPPPAAPAAAAGHGGMHHGSDGLQLWAVQSGPLGIVLTNAEGHVLHRFDGDSATPPTSNCTGECAATWPPVLLPAGKQPELLGVDAAQVGVLRRADGTNQVTLAGWPLYMWARDDGSLTTTAGQGTDGKWFAVAPDGSKVTTTP